MFEKWKKILDKEGECGALFLDFSNAFDCLQHELSLMRMGLIINRLNSSRVFKSTGNREQKLIHHLANENISLFAYHRDLS